MEAEVDRPWQPDVEALDEIGVGKNELVLRFNAGMYKGRFFFVKTDVFAT
jgi:hypothetical protein